MKVAVLGSTGFLGSQILEVINSQDDFELVLISGFTNQAKLLEQIVQYQPKFAYFPPAAIASPTSSQIISSDSQLEELLLGEEVEGVFFAVAGIDFLPFFTKLLSTSKPIWMASKEILILAGEVEDLSLERNKNLYPLDSEHHALWKMLRWIPRSSIDRLYLTASGGPFYEWEGSLNDITPEMALSHPNWQMGAKITVDSATLINKGLEVMEASYIFGVDLEMIDVIVQKESIIHALVGLKDGSLTALLSLPDMRSVIGDFMLSSKPVFSRPINFSQIKSLNFDYPVSSKFTGFYLAREVAKKGAGYPAYFCGADEACVRGFLERKTLLGEIPSILERVLEQEIPPPKTVEEVQKLYYLGFNRASQLIKQRSISC